MDVQSYNLIDEPWVKVLTPAGEVREVSLLDALANARDYVSLAGESASQDFAVLRVLLSVVYRGFAFVPGNRSGNAKKWRQAWDDGLPVETIERYLDGYRDRFDLIDPERPFLQAPTLTNSKNAWKDPNVLVPDCPGFGAMYIRRDPTEPLGFAEAARWLIHCHAYDIAGIKTGATGDSRVKGGKGYPIGTGWAGWFAGLTIEGDNLLETILLNIVPTKDKAFLGTPAWERPVPGPAEASPAEIGEIGQLTLFTWPQRRIRLRVEGDRITGARVSNGDPVDYVHQLGVETMCAWRYSKPQTKKYKQDIYMPRAIDPDRALWRGITSLLPQPKQGTEALPSETLRHLAAVSLRGRAFRNRVFCVRAVGYEYGPQSASYARALEDTLTFRGILLDLEAIAIAQVNAAVTRTDAAVRALTRYADDLAVAAGGDRGVRSPKVRAEAFAAIDPLFRAWLRDLNGTPEELEAKLVSWTDEVRGLISDMGTDIVRTTPLSAWAGHEENGHLVDVGTADKWFRLNLRKALSDSLDASAAIANRKESR